MPESDDAELLKLLAENEKPVEETHPSKKVENPYKDKKNDESNDYEFSDDKDLSDDDW